MATDSELDQHKRDLIRDHVTRTINIENEHGDDARFKCSDDEATA